MKYLAFDTTHLFHTTIDEYFFFNHIRKNIPINFGKLLLSNFLREKEWFFAGEGVTLALENGGKVNEAVK